MLKNFVLETANAPGTSTTFNLAGASTDRFSFAGAGFSNGDLVFYVMDDGAQFEWGIGTFNTGSPNTLSRTTVKGNSAGNTSRLNFTGTTDIYNDVPAEYLPFIDSNLLVALPGALAVTGQLIGGGTTTNDDAAAGKIGEYLTASLASGSATSLVSGTPKDVVTRSLTAGDWIVTATAIFNAGGGAGASLIQAAISTTANTPPTVGSENNIVNLPGSFISVTPILIVGPTRITVASSATARLVATSTFSPSSCSVYGFISARRVR